MFTISAALWPWFISSTTVSWHQRNATAVDPR